MFGPNPVVLPERCECCGGSLRPGGWSDEIVDGGYMVLCRPCKKAIERRQVGAPRQLEAAA